MSNKIWSYKGFCPSCQSATTFIATNEWLRDYLTCGKCPGGSVPRERALALALNEIRPNWRELSIHESSPSPTGFSVILSQQAEGYLASQYFPDKQFGEIVDGVRNENLEQQTFAAESFDIVITLDVMEHVYYPEKVIKEVYRTLKTGGVYVCTFPVRNYQVQAVERRFEYEADGSIRHFKDPEVHGNPVNMGGSIVTVDYGYDLHKAFADWAPFDVRVTRFHDEYHGIIGEYTDVVVCQKRRPRI